MNRLATQELEAIRKRSEQATEGPWKVFEKDDERNIGTSWEHPQLRGSLPVVTLGTYAKEPHHRVYIKEANADFIANARTDIPKLLAEVERLRKAFDQLNDNRTKWMESHGELEAENFRLKEELTELNDEIRVQAERDDMA